MAKELADDWWNQNRNLITGFRHYQFRDRMGSKKTTQLEKDIMKYEMEPIKHISFYERD
jgi:hypothetical protein